MKNVKTRFEKLLPLLWKELRRGLLLAFLGLSIGSAYAQTSPVYVGPRGNSYDDPANGIYVSPDGNDATATGTIDAPYKSINKALEVAEPNSTVILRSGKYFQEVSTRIRKPNITIKSKKGEWAVIELPFTDDPDNGQCGVFFDPEASDGKLQCVEVIGGFYAVCMDTKWGWGGNDDWMAASNIIIEDCKLHDSRYDVVKVKPNCKNITIRYNEIYNSGKAFAGNPQNGEDNAEGIDNVNGDNMTVHNNYIHDICSTGVYAKGGATDVLIENNLIKQAYGAGIMVGFDTSPEFFDTEVNPQYYENIRGIVHNNLIINSGWEGIGLYASKDALIYNNTLVNVDNGGLYHSAIYFGLSYQDWDTIAGRPANVNPNIHHNLICQPTTFVRPMIEIRYSNDLGGLSALDGNPTMNDNCYYIAGKSAIFTDRRPGSLLENAGLPEWKAHIDGDNGSLEVDPALNADYMPANAQCEGMGILSPFIINNLTGIVETQCNAFMWIYPNPTDGQLIVECRDAINGVSTNIEIFDVMGRAVRAYQFLSFGGVGVVNNGRPVETLRATFLQSTTINISHLPPGVYFVKLTTETGSTVKKIIKK
jgi:hypothetical protein